MSPGTSRYVLTVAFENGTLMSTTAFPAVSTYLVTNLVDGIDYVFTLYGGNSYGVDYAEGVSVVASTYSTPLPFFFAGGCSNSTSWFNSPPVCWLGRRQCDLAHHSFLSLGAFVSSSLLFFLIFFVPFSPLLIVTFQREPVFQDTVETPQEPAIFLTGLIRISRMGSLGPSTGSAFRV